jgi:competence protein ComEC
MSIELLESIIAAIVRLPFADISIANISGHMWFVIFAPALWVLLPKGWPGRWLAVLAVAALILYVPKPPRSGCFDAYVLDAGQGLATLVKTKRHLLVFDTGMLFRGGGSVAKQVLVPFLKGNGLRRIDWLLVSHADIDHSGGVVHLSGYADIVSILAGERLQAVPTATKCQAGQYWIADGISFRVLHPDPATPWVGNNASCVLLVTAGEHGLLLTGDIEADAERELVRSDYLRPVDVVVVPHHGSLTSSSRSFVDITSPQIAIVSAGYENRWGFPKQAVVERWQSVGSEVLNTATAGAISTRVCKQAGIIALRKDRHERRRFWRDAER